MSHRFAVAVTAAAAAAGLVTAMLGGTSRAPVWWVVAPGLATAAAAHPSMRLSPGQPGPTSRQLAPSTTEPG